MIISGEIAHTLNHSCKITIFSNKSSPYYHESFPYQVPRWYVQPSSMFGMEGLDALKQTKREPALPMQCPTQCPMHYGVPDAVSNGVLGAAPSAMLGVVPDAFPVQCPMQAS